jgi:cAMP-binding proteins - catabolite gene activator and regulatory subunit of cAMP-dependent protein kinases
MRNTWGPPEAGDLIERDGRSWFEVITPEVLEKSPLFAGADPLLLHSVIMSLHACAADAGETIVRIGDTACEMYLISRGQVEVIDQRGKVIKTLRDGDCFGELGLLLSSPRSATIRAKTQCDLFVLRKADFSRILRDHAQFADTMIAVAKERYAVSVSSEELMAH